MNIESTQQEILKQIKKIYIENKDVDHAWHIYQRKISANKNEFDKLITTWNNKPATSSSYIASQLNKQDVPVETKEAYSTDDLLNLSKKNFFKELTQLLKKNINILFDNMFETNSLFSKLQGNPEKFQILLHILDNHEITKLISGEYLTKTYLDTPYGKLSIFSSLATTPAGMLFLSQLLYSNSELTNFISASHLTSQIGPDCTVLQQLSTCNDPQIILLYLLTQNQTIALNISTDDLFKINETNDGETSAAFELSRSADDKPGAMILDTILALNRKIAEEIHISHLTRIYTNTENKHNNRSVLFNLAIKSPKNLLNLIMQNELAYKSNNTKHYLLTEFKLDDFLHVVPGIGTAFEHLCRSRNGRLILRRLIEINPEFAKEISLKLLCENQYGISPLVSLCKAAAKEDCTLLEYLMEMNPSIKNELTAKLLFDVDPNQRISAMSCLAETSTGCHFALRLLKMNPAIAPAIKYIDLISPLPHSNTNINQEIEPLRKSVYTLLKKKPEGEDVLNYIYQKNEQIDKLMEAKMEKEGRTYANQLKGFASLFQNSSIASNNPTPPITKKASSLKSNRK